MWHAHNIHTYLSAKHVVIRGSIHEVVTAKLDAHGLCITDMGVWKPGTSLGTKSSWHESNGISTIGKIIFWKKCCGFWLISPNYSPVPFFEYVGKNTAATNFPATIFLSKRISFAIVLLLVVLASDTCSHILFVQIVGDCPRTGSIRTSFRLRNSWDDVAKRRAVMLQNVFFDTFGISRCLWFFSLELKRYSRNVARTISQGSQTHGSCLERWNSPIVTVRSGCNWFVLGPLPIVRLLPTARQWRHWDSSFGGKNWWRSNVGRVHFIECNDQTRK